MVGKSGLSIMSLGEEDVLREATSGRLDHESHQHEWACWQRKYSEGSAVFSGFPGGGSSVCPSLLGHDDLIFFGFS